MEDEQAAAHRLLRPLPRRRHGAENRLTTTPAAGATRCARCDTQVGPGLLSCPQCGQLVHAAALKQLAADAERAESAGDLASASSRWQDALALLPPATRQADVIAARIKSLGERMTASPAAKPAEKRPAWARGGGVLGAIGLVLWKLKVVIILLLTKAKLLLLGLTKLSTVLSMLLSFGVYWTVWGWKFAAGIVGSIYIHEMGHVTWLRRYGIRASAPMFIPGLGALVRLRQYPPTPGLDARVGLAGPLYGLGAAAIAWGCYLGTGSHLWGAIARVGAWINLFNLLPVWSLDGGRGFRALTRTHRLIAAGVAFAAWLYTQESMLLVISVVAAVRAFARDVAEQEDVPVLAWYTGLIMALALLARLPVNPQSVMP